MKFKLYVVYEDDRLEVSFKDLMQNADLSEKEIGKIIDEIEKSRKKKVTFPVKKQSEYWLDGAGYILAQKE